MTTVQYAIDTLSLFQKDSVNESCKKFLEILNQFENPSKEFINDIAKLEPYEFNKRCEKMSSYQIIEYARSNKINMDSFNELDREIITMMKVNKYVYDNKYLKMFTYLACTNPYSIFKSKEHAPSYRNRNERDEFINNYNMQLEFLRQNTLVCIFILLSKQHYFIKLKGCDFFHLFNIDKLYTDYPDIMKLILSREDTTIYQSIQPNIYSKHKELILNALVQKIINDEYICSSFWHVSPEIHLDVYNNDACKSFIRHNIEFVCDEIKEKEPDALFNNSRIYNIPKHIQNKNLDKTYDLFVKCVNTQKYDLIEHFTPILFNHSKYFDLIKNLVITNKLEKKIQDCFNITYNSVNMWID